MCNTSLFAQGLLTYITLGETLAFSPPPSPFVQQPQFRPWELGMLAASVEEELKLIVEVAYAGTRPSKSWIRQQEDMHSITRLRHAISNGVVNNTVIVVPVRSRDWLWVINMNCRFSYLGQSNVLYWAMDEDAAALLQIHKYRFYYNPTLSGVNKLNPLIAEAKNKFQLWHWVIDIGVHLLYIEPTVAIFHNPLDALHMDADIEAIIDESSIDAATTLTKRSAPTVGTGVIWLRATGNVKEFLDQLRGLLDSGDYADDTDVLNKVLRDHPKKYTVANPINNQPDQPFTPETQHNATMAVLPTPPADTTHGLSYRYVSPLDFVNEPIFTEDMHLHTSGYSSAFSLQQSNWDDDRFYPTLLYIGASEFQDYEVTATQEQGEQDGSRMVERWRSLGWWELNSEGKCALLASLPNASYA
jgi:Nucleotide-diphospho-sugar transferase